MNAQEIWDIAYSQLELQLDRASFNTWLRGATFMGVVEGIYVVGVRNDYAREMLQHRLYANIHRVVSDVCGEPVELRFEVRMPEKPARGDDEEMPLFRLLAQQANQYLTENEDNYDDEPLHQRISRPQLPAIPESELNPRFIFDRFIVSNANRMTYEAARAIAENPAAAYNPFLVYGGVGLGKTHLLQSIAHVCKLKGLDVVYISSEAFTNDLIDSIRRKTTAMFRDKYRSADVLLVDDVQFIAGKDSTQEEFFHTFNALYTFNKQIILASDRHPSELTTLEDRLRSRFEGGLVTDVQPMELESRLALLRMWTQERSVVLQQNVLEMIAERAQGNVRELEGLFNQIIAKAQLSRGVLTLEGAENMLERFHRPRQHTSTSVTAKRVIEVTAGHFQVKPQDITGKRRTGRINQARQVAMYLVREMTDASLPQIGEIFGGRSHTTVLHGCNKIMEEMDYDPSLCHRIEEIRLEVLDI